MSSVSACCWRLSALLCVSLSLCAVGGLVFDPIAPTIVSVTSPSCTAVERNGTREASQCTADLASVVLQLKGTDWNGILELPVLTLLTPLNVPHYFDCEQDADWGVVTVGHEAWEVSCALSSYTPLEWYEQQGALGLQIQDPPYLDPSEIFWGLTTSSPPQTTTAPVLYAIYGCMFDCRPGELILLTGANLAGVTSVVGSSWAGSLYNMSIWQQADYYVIAQLPFVLLEYDLNSYLLIEAFAANQPSLNFGLVVVGSPRVYPVVLGLGGCELVNPKARTASQCVGGESTLFVSGRGWSSELTGWAVLLISPIGNTYECTPLSIYNTGGSGDSFDAVCTLPVPSASETYARWQVAVRDDQNGLSEPYAGLTYAAVAVDSSLPLVARVYCTSGCYSGDVLAIDGQQLSSAAVTIVSLASGDVYGCASYAQSDTRITCVLPYVMGVSVGISLDMRVEVSNDYGMGETGQITVTQSPPVPRITGIYSVDGCSARSSMAVQGCRPFNHLWIRSEGWTSDVDDTGAQVVLVTPIGREVACAWLNSNFSTTSGVMFVLCFLPVVSWQETALAHSLAIAAPDSTDTWYWSDATTAAVQYNVTATPASALTLPAAYGVVLDCPTISNVSYCTNRHTMTVEGARLTDPVTVVLAGLYAVQCVQLVFESMVSCSLPTIRPVDVGLVLEVDIYTSAGRAPTAYPPILTYAASDTYQPSGVPIPVLSSSAPPVPRPSSSSSSSSSATGRATSSPSSSSSARSSSSSSRLTSTPTSQTAVRSSSSSSSSAVRRSSSSSSSAGRSSSSIASTAGRSTAATSSSTGAGRSSSSTATARPFVTSSSSSLTARSSSSSSGPAPVTSSTSGPIVFPPSSSSSSSSSTGSDSSSSAASSSGGMSGGAVAGIVVLVLVVVLGGGAGGLCWKYGCPAWLGSRRSGPRSVDELLNMPDSSMDGDGAGYVPPSYATNSAATAGAAASYQPPNAQQQHTSGVYNNSNPYLPPSMHSSMLPPSRPASDAAAQQYAPPSRYAPPPAPSRSSIFFSSSTVHGSVDSTDGYAGHTADDY